MQSNRIPFPSVRVPVTALLLLCSSPLQAQHGDRIWGRVVTEEGESHEGFIHLRGYRSGASWADILRVSREIPEQQYQDWLEATRGGAPHIGTVDLKGYRITWEEKHPAFAQAHRAGIRFGHLAELRIDEGGRRRLVAPTGVSLQGRVEVVTRSDHEAEFEPGDSVAQYSGYDVTFESVWSHTVVWIDSGGSSVEVHGHDVARIEFGAAPSGSAAPSSPRLYATVEDRNGRSFRGFLTWDRDDVLESHILDGFWEDVPGLANPWESGKYERSFGFSDIRSLERTPCFARVTLKSDTVMELCSEPFERDPRPVRISDPALGLIEVEWDAVRILHFEPSPGTPGYDAFDGGRPLSGTVVTRKGEEIEGRIRWNANEEWSWELLQGSSNDVHFSIEFGNIAHIEREELEGARVTLQDGRSFHLTGGYDVGEDNRGIFIFPVPADGVAAGQPVPEWRYVAWADFREVRFHHADDNGAGS